MNNRIKELDKQAKTKTIKEFEGITFQWEDFYLRRSEILAELLVQECAELMKTECEEYKNVGSDFCDHKAEAFDEAIYLVKKHFGVEK